MPQYLISVWHDDDYDVDFIERRGPAPRRPGRRLQRGAPGAGAWVFGGGLHPAVLGHRRARPRTASVSMTDGPYAESKEQMGGFWVIEAPDLDAALDWARKAAAACEGPVEVRPIQDELTTSTAVFRREAGRCTATLIRVLGDIDLAEDAVAEAFAIAAERWPVTGIAARTPAAGSPRRPATGPSTGSAGKSTRDRPPPRRPPPPRHRHGTRRTTPTLDDLDDFVDVVADDQLRLMFLCCHPALGARRPGGAHPAAARRARDARDRPRLPRARGDDGPAHRAGQAQAPRQPRPLPHPAGRPSCPTACTPCSPPSPSSSPRATPPPPATDLVRVDLSSEAIRLGRVLVELMPDEPEAVGLLALMLLTDARRPARTAADGSMVRLADQDRTRVGPRR